MYSLYINDRVSSIEVVKADTYWRRLKGWMFKASVAADESLWISPCNSIHTLCMRFSIDAIFLDEQGRVLRLCEKLRPGRAKACMSASHVLEMCAGSIARLNIVVNDRLTLKETQ